MPTYFESHAHYDDRRFDEDRYSLLASLPGKNVHRVINAGSDISSSRASVALAEAFDFIYAAVGVHPHEAKTLTEEKFRELEGLCRHPRVVAVGETGLDFYYEHAPRELQRHWFKEHLKLAAKTGLPVVVHSREAARETFDIIRERAPAVRGVLHSYSGSIPMAMDYIEMGFYIGIGGVVTFDKSRKLPDVVSAIPLEKILIETDAPYMTPAPYRGKRNDSSYLKYIVEAIAKIRGITTEEAAGQTLYNAEALFIPGNFLP